ncbi:hypothetical protein [Rossellomorea sp. NS-SX7]|uniref:hypothetical protein n=1 Tax=Rossellomorea sp. NS-SX7 TaxID=3463856 RepID=UPI00405910CE
MLPYSLMLFMLMMMAGVASTSMFLSKYQYLSNMGKIYERKVSIAHGVMLSIDRGTVGTFVHHGSFGQTESKTSQLSDQHMVMEITYQSTDKVFMPVLVVYNKDTKHIIDWK